MLLFPTSTWILSISQTPFQLELLQNLLLVHPMQTPRSLLVLLGFSLRIPGGLQDSEPPKNQLGRASRGLQTLLECPPSLLAGGAWSRKVLKGAWPLLSNSYQQP